MTQEERILKLLKGALFFDPAILKSLAYLERPSCGSYEKARSCAPNLGFIRCQVAPKRSISACSRLPKKVPGGVICLLTAVRFHQIGTQEPYQVWIAIGRKSKKPKISSPILRIFRFSEAALQYGVEEHKILGTTIRITSPAKTVADCFKYRNKVGLDVALEAGRDCIYSRKATISEIYECAKVCRVANIIRPYLEVWQY
jgi:hypothetical protein